MVVVKRMKMMISTMGVSTMDMTMPKTLNSSLLMMSTQHLLMILLLSLVS